ncbi:Peptidoglycan/LPS O-acetylase OafA/YrhL, contains acyltransferase and SGNH-hydrolase domains [Acetitomaculum ruminis DSM 5522]|uniref:Peptidoglycan/LPS O-acetylase OafA/YrhL, contains acyltransferase and SGNH-hydrolase domains n=1 Tax=Acetitomaculum ruminis DSM 5522 TaxID=1120918 RepID=A0A1I0ZW10_9FIRM|nr:acyltransferase [Acetitomaculum ruminis]SFB29954.1 Peptidoglycan/LPS O-acetylase OafA/YrhL, contains acyltransferase and SGNH-hydrolase domains [Acetitomaculum ruminis DSM 5522]
MKNKKERIYSYDTFRLIAAFCVVALHFPMRNRFGDELSVLARIGVPFFFLISGYFHFNHKELDYKKIIKELLKIIKYLIICNTVYFLYTLNKTAHLYHGKEDAYFLAAKRIILKLLNLRFLFFNFGLAGHLWYLRAMLILVIVFALVKKFHLEKLVLFTIPVIMIIDYSMGQYAPLIWGHPISWRLIEPIEKFLGVGYCYFFIGYFLHRFFEDSDLYKKLRDKIRGKEYLLIGFIFLFTAFNVFEAKYLLSMGIKLRPLNYIGTFFLVLSIFIFLSFFPNLGGGKYPFSKIGKECAEHIYFWHVIYGKILGKIIRHTPYYSFFAKYRTILIYLSLLIIILIIVSIKSLIVNKIKAKKESETLTN